MAMAMAYEYPGEGVTRRQKVQNVASDFVIKFSLFGNVYRWERAEGMPLWSSGPGFGLILEQRKLSLLQDSGGSGEIGTMIFSIQMIVEAWKRSSCLLDTQWLNMVFLSALIRNDSSKWLTDCSASIPTGLITWCDLYAIWRGLFLVWDCGNNEIICETDCLEASL
ncbi:hypothetical protein AHAS_Ahas20G0224400 [Arachis hypogaea]